ncbi:Similar to hypothetical protein TRIVIDRAFT_122435, partial [Trichoderma virens Gv29-8]; acc. no. EHK19922 [Pyronema omphalodes CBS 100304]|uniref:Uncharacterized protein n=1 Tax=Pyronema omphalodes (strain CBS 100304) TaxID=1076935 RepID=U4LF00_PYROM
MPSMYEERFRSEAIAISRVVLSDSKQRNLRAHLVTPYDETEPPRREIDVSVPLSQRSRTFRLSGIPGDVTQELLSLYLDGLDVGDEEGTSLTGNSTVSSLVPYKSWQVATVSFDREPKEFRQCKPGKASYLFVQSLQGVGASTASFEIVADCDFYCLTPLYQSPDAIKYDIIAVTGLSGHAFGSWKSTDLQMMPLLSSIYVGLLFQSQG